MDFKNKPRLGPVGTQEKHLVAEQPGLAILGAGILISLLLGFVIRGLIHPSKIQVLVAEAASRIDKNIKVRFASAEISLSDGFFPRLALLVREIHMESSNACWMLPSLDIDELSLPLNLWTYVTEGRAIADVEAGRVLLRLDGKKAACSDVKVDRGTSGPRILPPPSQAVVLVQKKERKEVLAPMLERILIERLEIDPRFYPQAQAEMTEVELVLKSQEPKIVSLKAQSHFLKDPEWGEYTARGQVNIVYSEFPEKNLEVHLSGHWREGSYSWHNSYALEDDFFRSEVEVRHIPLSKLGLISSHWDLERLEPLRQSWLSLKAKATGHFDKIEKSELEIRDLKIEGDSGDLFIDKLAWTQVSDRNPQPFLARMKGLSLEMLVKLGLNSPSSPILRDIGRFTGRIEVDDTLNLRMLGELEGLQLVFANKGQRVFQNIQKMTLDLQRAQGNWNLDVSRLEPEQGVFNGELTAVADPSFEDVKVKLFAEEMSFSPAVQNLMSGGGSLGSFQSRIDFGFRKGVLNRLQGKLTGQNIEIDSFRIPKFTMKFQNQGDNKFGGSLQIQDPSLGRELLVETFLNPLIDLLPEVEGQYQLKNFKSQFSLKDFHSIQWKSFSAKHSKGTLKGAVEWTPEGVLTGFIQLKNNQGPRKFLIEGTRDRPSLTPTTGI